MRLDEQEEKRRPRTRQQPTRISGNELPGRQLYFLLFGAVMSFARCRETKLWPDLLRMGDCGVSPRDLFPCPGAGRLGMGGVLSQTRLTQGVGQSTPHGPQKLHGATSFFRPSLGIGTFTRRALITRRGTVAMPPDQQERQRSMPELKAICALY
ncbi:hypothetical protein VTK26DRAFT_6701 [Humicola hyalothermophila]